MSKKVCMLNGNLILREKKTGVHLFHENVTKGLVNLKRDYDIVSACFDFDGNCKRYAEHEKNSWIKPVLSITKAYRLFAYILPIELFFGKNDVYICDGFYPHSIQKSTKRICIVHDLMVKLYPQYYSPVRRIYLNLYFSQLKKADYVACVSENTKKDIERLCGVEDRKIKVIKSSYIECKSNKSCPDSSLIDISIPFVFYIGDMRPNKNLENTIKGFIRFCEKHKTEMVRMYIAGGWNENYLALKRFAESSGYGKRIIFLGYISDNDKFYLYHYGRAVLLISEYEGFGVPIIEGFKYGTPVVTSRCSSMEELGERAAVLVNPYDIVSISRGIEEAYYQEYEPDRNLAAERVRENSFPNVVRLLDKIIRMVL